MRFKDYHWRMGILVSFGIVFLVFSFCFVMFKRLFSLEPDVAIEVFMRTADATLSFMKISVLVGFVASLILFAFVAVKYLWDKKSLNGLEEPVVPRKEKKEILIPWDELAKNNFGKACSYGICLVFLLVLFFVIIFADGEAYDSFSRIDILAGLCCTATLLYWTILIIFFRLERKNKNG